MATVLIVGKPNVGKSTLFNKLVRKRKAIVEDEEGVTRDPVQDTVEWYGKTFRLVDTCGVFDNPQDVISKKMKEVTLNMIREADLVLFVVDGKNGITKEDESLADFLRKSGVDVILVANKTENQRRFEREIKPELYRLGFGDPIPVSAEHSINLDTLMEKIIQKLEEKGLDLETKPEITEAIKIAIVGRPNVGKSTLFNAILNKERALVSPIPGTTRDPVDDEVFIDGKKYIFVDTAGLRRKSRIEPKTVERYSTYRVVESIERADVAVIVLDATQGITRQDQRIAGLVERKGKASVVVFNKWDLVEHREKRYDEFTKLFREKLYFVDYSPLIFTSADKGWGVEKIIDAINLAYSSYTTKVPSSALNSALQKVLAFTNLPRGLKIFFGLQVDIKPPTFLFFVNNTEKIKEPQKVFLRRLIREYVFPFEGSPIFLKFKKSR
ncbi:ribosome biogenesis GTPase Der [Thermotoga neapolitana]|uniref:GTPase Der n=1 Tax=Thermotoga neapolitana (strain ATCC 49049 / DSM 4359 / NBRC 107923 / NS-E) TaxID=309803 RepID=DER_THENN|nr:ribosome biogenesis GTPase Der [Thermotoga neapolitana]B9K8E0.1 RecName: Full=GTPase Der; AltName: Full=GTP-binding protein EngA [Thermotoga neapolitana DSM 4359]MDK2949357.1 GTPase [Thermotoga sp.]ACM23223.1 GTP-binding protein engA [Thermotoga neapolitana DSM 4359]KFZ21727.1 GTP-binding protein Der [Thermotoga neapolitana LA10]HBF11496.1 ribosome biogenesis GTPase Der [Thermotoga neapolitana]